MKRPALLAALLLVASCGSEPAVAPHSPLRLTLERRLLLGEQPARELAFSPDGAMLATSSADGMIALWPTHRRGKPRLLRHPGGAAALAFSADGKRLATGGYDGNVMLWDPAAGKAVQTLHGAEGTVWSVALSPDGRRVAGGGEDKSVHLWDAGTGRTLARLRGHSLNIWKVLFSPDGKTLASSSFDRTVRLWDAATGRALRILAGHGQAIVGLAYSRDGRVLASGSDDSTVRLWRAADGAPLRRMEAGNHVYSVAFSPDGKLLAGSGRARGGLGTFVHQATGLVGPGQVRLWSVPDGRLLAAAAQPEDALSIAFSRDGLWLATASEDGTVSLWRIEAAP